MPKRWTIQEENQKRSELVDLYINQNKTISEVGEVLRIAEKTVFKRLKRLNIQTIPEKKDKYLNRNWKRINFPDLSDKLAEFFGIMLGDGHISSGQISICLNSNSDRDYKEYVNSLLTFLFAIEPGIHYRKDNNALNLFLSSVDLIAYLKEKGLYATNKVKEQVDIPYWILTKDSYKKHFLRGFFDTDGSIYKLRFGVQMSFCNHSVPLLKSTRDILLNLGYNPSRMSSYKIYLTRKPNLYRYIQEIGFGNFKHTKRAKEFGII